ncbi:MAG TPA: transcription termination/antitermination NusG family protein [Gemmataceae bacterium]|nr:transcription termination/antitermination NusG family protein [Gemmataceae bacterium]
MPVLPLEPFVSPDDLFSDPESVAANPGRWWVLHTRPRAEKRLARELLGKGKSFFLPLHSRTWRHNGSTLSSHLPLFPSYVFLHGDEEARWAALKTNQVAQVIPVVDQGQLHDDLTRVHQLMVSGLPLTPEDRLEPGSPVEIIRGPLTGLTATVLKRGKGLRLVVEVRLLQRGVSAEIESWMVRALP